MKKHKRPSSDPPQLHVKCLKPSRCIMALFIPEHVWLTCSTCSWPQTGGEHKQLRNALLHAELRRLSSHLFITEENSWRAKLTCRLERQSQGSGEPLSDRAQPHSPISCRELNMVEGAPLVHSSRPCRRHTDRCLVWVGAGMLIMSCLWLTTVHSQSTHLTLSASSWLSLRMASQRRETSLILNQILLLSIPLKNICHLVNTPIDLNKDFFLNKHLLKYMTWTITLTRIKSNLFQLLVKMGHKLNVIFLMAWTNSEREKVQTPRLKGTPGFFVYFEEARRHISREDYRPLLIIPE